MILSEALPTIVYSIEALPTEDLRLCPLQPTVHSSAHWAKAGDGRGKGIDVKTNDDYNHDDYNDHPDDYDDKNDCDDHHVCKHTCAPEEQKHSACDMLQISFGQIR